MDDRVRALARAARRKTPRRVRSGLFRMGTFMDPDVGRHSAVTMSQALRRLRQHGFSPGVVVDVGAYTGGWTDMVTDVYPGCRVVMIEPQEQLASALLAKAEGSGGLIEFHPALLGAEGGRIVEFVEMSTGSSVLEEQSPFPRERVSKVLEKLDDVLGPLAESVDLLKLDVQGYELEVLRGAPRALGSAEVVVLEASLIPTNVGCPLLAEVIGFMNQAGFDAYDIPYATRRRDGELWQVDLVFLRAGSRFGPGAQLSAENW